MGYQEDNWRRTIVSDLKQRGTPVFAIYLDQSVTPSTSRFYLNNGTFYLDVNTVSDSLTVSVDGKTPRQIAAEFSESSLPVIVKPLVDTVPLSSEDYINIGSIDFHLYFDDATDVTPDGGYLIRLKRHQVHYLEQTRIRLLAPHFSLSKNPWYARVNTGIINLKKDGKNYIFGIPEYDNQEWSLEYGKPYISIAGESSVPVSDRSISVSRTPIYWEKNNIHIVVDNKAIPSNRIQDVDRWNGQIYFRSRLPENSAIDVFYTYREDAYIYKGIDLNASAGHNPQILGSAVLFYLVPWRDVYGVINKTTVRHVVARTIEDAISTIPSSTDPVLLLGAVYVRESASVEDVDIVDTRTRGGGLHDQYLRDSLEIIPELNFFWDTGAYEGIAYPGNASIVMSIPDYRQKMFEPRDLKNRATRFLAAGVLPIMDRGDNYDPHKSLGVAKIDTFENGFLKNKLYWSNKLPSIPSSFTGVSTGDLPSLQMSGNTVVLDPNTDISQRYLKTSAPTVITYQQRTSDDNSTYTSWEDVRLVDERTTTGFLLGGRLDIAAGIQYKQVRNIQVSSTYAGDVDFCSDLSGEIVNIYKNITGLSDSNGRQIYNIINLGLNYSSDVDWGPGPTSGQLALMDMWDNAPQMTGYLVKVGDSILGSFTTGNTTGENFITMPSRYSEAQGYHYDTSGWYDWTRSVLMLSKLYEKTNLYKYYSGAQTICRSVVSGSSLEGNYIPSLLGNNVDYVIPSRFMWNGSRFDFETPDVVGSSPSYGEVAEILDYDHLLDGAYAFSSFDSSGELGLRAIASMRYADRLIADGWSGFWYFSGNSFSGHNYYTFDHLGNIAGHNLQMVQNSLEELDSNIPFYSDAANSVSKIANKVYTTFTGAASLQGWIPKHAGKSIDSLARIGFNPSGLLSIVNVYTKGCIDDNGNVYQVDSFQGHPTYISPEVPSEIFTAYGNMLDLDPSISGMSQLMFYQTVHMYKSQSGYPVDAYDIMGRGGGEDAVLKGFIDLFNQWQT